MSVIFQELDATIKQSTAEDKAYQQNVACISQNICKSGPQMLDNIPNNSNCLFYAIADQINLLGEFWHNHTSLRHLPVETLRKGSHDVSPSGCLPLRRNVPC